MNPNSIHSFFYNLEIGNMRRVQFKKFSLMEKNGTFNKKERQLCPLGRGKQRNKEEKNVYLGLVCVSCCTPIIYGVLLKIFIV